MHELNKHSVVDAFYMRSHVHYWVVALQHVTSFRGVNPAKLRGPHSLGNIEGFIPLNQRASIGKKTPMY
jgi:hypothetical protein